MIENPQKTKGQIKPNITRLTCRLIVYIRWLYKRDAAIHWKVTTMQLHRYLAHGILANKETIKQ